MFRHVVLFRVRDDVADPEVSAAIELLRSLGDGTGILSWTVELSRDRRKGRVIVEDGTFSSDEAFDAWRAHSRHQKAAEHLSGIADWLVGDWTVADNDDNS